MGVVVQKFGGSSLKDAERVMEAARKAIRAKHVGNQVIVVVSAQGSTTDDLIAKAAEITAFARPDARYKERHVGCLWQLRLLRLRACRHWKH